MIGKDGEPLMIPGTLKGTKAIGWYIEEYGIAQVSMNITDLAATPLHIAFDEVTAKAAARGIRVTGLEIVGLVPKRTIIDAADHYLRKQRRSLGVTEAEKIKLAIRSMGLDDLKPWDPDEKIIEYVLERTHEKKRLTDLTCRGFADETASESPAPVAARSRPTWERSELLWLRWSQTFRRTKQAGTTVGKSFRTMPLGRSA